MPDHQKGPRFLFRGWPAPIAVGLVGLALTLFAFWSALRADEQRVLATLEFRADWRARDLEAKILQSGNAVEIVAVTIAANAIDTPDAIAVFSRVAARAQRGLAHVNSLQWAPRVARSEIAALEQAARALGHSDYAVFDVTEDLQRTALGDRPEYFPVLLEERYQGNRRALGLALGKYEGRRIPMERARDDGGPVATAPVRPIGGQSDRLVYLLFWPVYAGIDVPATLEQRRAELRGYALGNYDLAAILTAALADTPAEIDTLQFAVGDDHQHDAEKQALAHFSPASKRVELGAAPSDPSRPTAFRLHRDFSVFGQHWDLIFDFSAEEVAPLRSQGAYGWLLAGLLLTGSMMFYLFRERQSRQQIEALVETRTAELAHTNEQLYQAQKMEAVGTMTGGIAHDFNNLLAVVIGNLDLLQERLAKDPKTSALVESALQAGERGAELTRQLLAFSRRQPLAPKVVAVNDLVSGTARMLERILEENIEVVLNTAPDAWPVLIDPAQLSAVIANLATNARDAMPEGGQLMIATKNVHLDADYAALNPDVAPGDYVLMEVADTGTGMSARTLERAFEPFFTTKEVGRGTGLGLSMVFGFVKQSNGHIKIYSELGHGTVVRIYLPRATFPDGPTTAAAGIPEPEAAQRNECILLVEDNAGVRDIVARQLAELGYRVVVAESPKAALTLLRDPAVAIDLLFTDLIMPEMDGMELADAASAARPGLRFLFTSGYSGSRLLNHERLRGGDSFLSKPYRKQELARKLRDILDR